ncbi:hypothetical protein [Rhodococcus sp. 05-2254-6]|nr:hypothetical protein [Rhodococcus sp. 05-2254-6]
MLADHGVQVDVVDNAERVQLMERMLAERPSLWFEDIGEDA